MKESKFKLKSPYQPAGDQPAAIEQLCKGVQERASYQTLLGATGTGKTFTMANVIERTGKPTLIVSHNKTLAAQLFEEMRELFPENAVSYFVSYYDYYQPEAYIPQRDIYIEKDASRNPDLDRLRLAATSNLLSREDVIVIASVSCLYGLGISRRIREESHSPQQRCDHRPTRVPDRDSRRCSTSARTSIPNGAAFESEATASRSIPPTRNTAFGSTSSATRSSRFSSSIR